MRLASSMSTLSLNKRHSLIVRIGEKRILHIYLQRLDGLLAELKLLEETEKTTGKRKVAEDSKRARKQKRPKTQSF
jgi:hypothetical protein